MFQAKVFVATQEEPSMIVIELVTLPREALSSAHVPSKQDAIVSAPEMLPTVRLVFYLAFFRSPARNAYTD